ncbi:sensor histidine kinase [Duganella vulcania]|uniref:sensor histidine kinase n=1 Tax=Duganella vulcania TaxID=2692166 RepID=UPI001583607F|nr:sensor histidine kinase [Duganella vulcania]
MSTASVPRWSLRRLLLGVLLGLTLALWGGSAFIVYREAQRESQELFDQSLAETAQLLLSLAENEAREHGTALAIDLKIPERPDHHRYLLFQIRDARQRLLYKNGGAPSTAFAVDAPEGYSWTRVGGHRSRLYTSWNAGRTVQIQVAEPSSHRDEISTRFFYKASGLGVVLAILAGLAIWLCIDRVFRVLQVSADEVGARTPNDLADVPLEGAPSEVFPLLLAINRLFGRVRQTMEYEQRFTGDAAHELRTPLAAIKTNLQVMQRARSVAERDEFIAGLNVSVDRASRLVDQLLTLAHLDPQDSHGVALEQADLATLLTEEQAHWQSLAAGHQLQVDVAHAPCRIERESLRMLLRNLVDNAARYTPAPGRIVVSCGQADGHSYLRVADSGPGIPPAMRERVFERFFRLPGAKAPGSGLGLSIVSRIAAMHGATLSLDTGMDGRGLAVTVTFPALEKSLPRH